jgi:hypothetical protein
MKSVVAEKSYALDGAVPATALRMEQGNPRNLQ